MTLDFPYDLVTLRDFEAGWGWDAQVRAMASKKYRRDLAGLVHLDPEPLAQIMGAEILPQKPYQTVLWVMRQCPFRPLELYFQYGQDAEFGTDLRVFYARKSLAVPTEDAYVFAWDFLALLARYGRGTYSLQFNGPGTDWIPFEGIADQVGGPFQEFTLGSRVEVLPRISSSVAAVAILRLDRGTCFETQAGWMVIWPVLPDLLLRLRVEVPDIQVAFDNRGADKYPPEFLMSFAWLYINALIREARQVDPSLPRLSRYF